MKNKGVNQHRFKQNPIEYIFAKLWEEINCGKFPTTLDYILSKSNDPRTEVSERDREVAATAIQWLGSPVGQMFLNTINGKRKEV